MPALLAVIFVAISTSAQSYKLDSSTAPAPADLAAPVREAMSGNALAVTSASGPRCEIWLVKSVAPVATPDTSPGANFGQIPLGALIGAIKFDAPGGDYRGQSIKPGVYTLRYMVQPSDANHEGVSPYRDYLLAVPAALDSSAADVTRDDLLKLSRKAAGTDHPSVWSLVPADGAPAALPAIAHQNTGDLWVIFFAAPLPAPLKMGLVIVGRAPEA